MRKKPNFGNPVQDALETKNKREQKNFGILSCGHKRTTEIILNLRTARLIQNIMKNKWSVYWKTRDNLLKTLSAHIEASSK